ncbi:MAG: hypothetical protein ACOX7D_02260 [Alphaproteobacteria bacterium]|jgi:NTP pyrophosphatase (non-canonical NTP hydrolase)|nr:hypothetical protein [Alphaproteobacteria bacterium]
MDEETKKILVEVQKYKGKKYTILLAVEEMTELSKELLKNINRDKDNYDSIFEETTDVMVCLEYIKSAYKISDDTLNENINKKVRYKLLPRIEKWKAKK